MYPSKQETRIIDAIWENCRDSNSPYLRKLASRADSKTMIANIIRSQFVLMDKYLEDDSLNVEEIHLFRVGAFKIKKQRRLVEGIKQRVFAEYDVKGYKDAGKKKDEVWEKIEREKNDTILANSIKAKEVEANRVSNFRKSILNK
jgi:hypothetical protein